MSIRHIIVVELRHGGARPLHIDSIHKIMLIQSEVAVGDLYLLLVLVSLLA